MWHGPRCFGATRQWVREAPHSDAIGVSGIVVGCCSKSLDAFGCLAVSLDVVGCHWSSVGGLLIDAWMSGAHCRPLHQAPNREAKCGMARGALAQCGDGCGKAPPLMSLECLALALDVARNVAWCGVLMQCGNGCRKPPTPPPHPVLVVAPLCVIVCGCCTVVRSCGTVVRHCASLCMAPLCSVAGGRGGVPEQPERACTPPVVPHVAEGMPVYQRT